MHRKLQTKHALQRVLTVMVVIIAMIVMHIGCTHTPSNPNAYAKILSNYGWSPTYTYANFRYGCYTSDRKTSQIDAYGISDGMLSDVFMAQRKHTDGSNMILIATFTEQIDAKNCYTTATESISRKYTRWYNNQDDPDSRYMMASISYTDGDNAMEHSFKAVMLNQNSILFIEMNSYPAQHDSLRDFSDINADIINEFMHSTNAMQLIQELYGYSDEAPIAKTASPDDGSWS